MKTAELQGAALGWAVHVALRGECEGYAEHEYSTDWAHGGPIIEREHIEWQWLPSSSKDHQYGARKPSFGGAKRTFCMDGPTVLIAAMRCYVASKLGDEVEVPEELT
jgi:hypothetical protein